MIKNILITVLVIYALGMTVFANLKANEAEKQTVVAIKQERAAEQAAAEARKSEVNAITAEREAERQRDLAEAAMDKALADCK